jgi:cob(I)alamin adenosyltransferase
MKIYTRTGDQGTTGLFGGDRVPKSHPRITAYGTVDETNSVIGLARAQLPNDDRFARANDLLGRIQGDLFVVGADLATPLHARPSVPRIVIAQTEALESEIDAFEVDLPRLQHFILPGGSPAGGFLHVARTVCRRSERFVVELGNREPINEQVPIYLNRLSDLLFVVARWVNHQSGAEEAQWSPEPLE